MSPEKYLFRSIPNLTLMIELFLNLFGIDRFSFSLMRLQCMHHVNSEVNFKKRYLTQKTIIPILCMHTVC